MRDFNYHQYKENILDYEILELVSTLHEYRGKQDLLLKQKPGVVNKLIDLAKIQSVESSNKLEGIITTNKRIKDLVLKKTTPRNKDENEIAGYRDILNTIHEILTISL